jgi:transcriptional regulator with XRE-family HTH domain
MINGHTLRRLRRQKGFNQKDAAKRLGISLAGYSKLEQSVWLQGPQLQTILKALDCTTTDIEKAMALLN